MKPTLKDVPNKYLTAEIWEIEAILLWILASQVHHWTRWIFVLWGVFNLITGSIVKYYHWKEQGKI